MIHGKFGEVVGCVEDIDELIIPLLQHLQKGIFRKVRVVM
jgi:hypothetical protein